MTVLDTDSPDYSIVIPCYNEEDFLPATLKAVHEAMASVVSHRGEIVVTDNDSSDASAQIARTAGARVVFEKHRQISRARNAGGWEARGRYLIFVDADTLISPALLRAALAALDSGRVCGGGTVLQTDRDMGRLGRLLLACWNRLAPRIRVACGAFVYCLREGFTGVGGFTEELYVTEEIDFSRQLHRWGRERGLEFVVLGEPIVTSTRKIDWYGYWGALRAFARMLRPSTLRSRESCPVWYERPTPKSGG